MPSRWPRRSWRATCRRPTNRPPLIPPAIDLQQQIAPPLIPDTNSKDSSTLPGGNASPDTIKVLGLDLCLRDDKLSQVPQSQTVQLNSPNSPSQAAGPSQPPAPGGAVACNCRTTRRGAGG